MSVRGRYHRCEGRFCINCKRMVDTDHQCFIKTEKEREDEKRFKDEATIKGYIFFDHECMVGEFSRTEFNNRRTNLYGLHKRER